ncbi:MAG: hypothetical protein OXU72_05190 [Gammaproteobacteria bacterium]|nr:hypothetical protein [Gammaproteobacteria bacterium]
MRQIDCIHALHNHTLDAPPVLTKADLAHLLPHTNPHTFDATLCRLVASGVLVRAAQGIYVHALTVGARENILQHVACALRRGEYSYVSLETALSRWGAISEIPMRLTLMTTGRSQSYETLYGAIEFIHTSRSVISILDGTVRSDEPLRLAKAMTAYEDLKRVGRNLELVDLEELRDAA